MAALHIDEAVEALAWGDTCSLDVADRVESTGGVMALDGLGLALGMGKQAARKALIEAVNGQRSAMQAWDIIDMDGDDDAV